MNSQHLMSEFDDGQTPAWAQEVCVKLWQL